MMLYIFSGMDFKVRSSTGRQPSHPPGHLTSDLLCLCDAGFLRRAVIHCGEPSRRTLALGLVLYGPALRFFGLTYLRKIPSRATEERNGCEVYSCVMPYQKQLVVWGGVCIKLLYRLVEEMHMLHFFLASVQGM